ncbi:T9SS type A sorting domain-containing protein [Flavihumibacter rivuli]|uniref:T9SS type A sorting domain-containing protein n=1 Tax=Flavihumibacter rivuli TaxID=2838156 RepID=UPI001BDF64BB|nr:T9SS type A sorting domain-containing protein [Flavihumibacter rivuli]ULQ56171.1 T9SS type A sorting domain-containing protein [Flavihumibacter rivuli]
MFNPGTSSVTFNGLNNTTININGGGNGTISFYDVILDKPNSPGGDNMNIAAGDQVTVLNNLTLTNGTLGTGTGILQVNGNIDIQTGFLGALVDLIIGGNGNSIINVDAPFKQAGNGNITINKANAASTVSFVTNLPSNNIVLGPSTTAGALTINSGLVNFPDNDNFLLNFVNFSVNAPGAYNAGTGTVTLERNNAQTISINGPLTTGTLNFTNLVVNNTSGGGNVNLEIGDAIVVSNNLTISAGRFNTPGGSAINNSTIQVGGNITLNAAATATTAAIRLLFIGGNNQSVSLAAGTESHFNGPIEVTKSGGNITLLSPMIVDQGGQTFTFASGIINSTTQNYLQFGQNTTWSGASNTSHVNGPVRKSGTTAFTFPVGNGVYLGAIHMSGNTGFNDPLIAARTYQATYIRQNPQDNWPNTNQPPTFGNPPQLITISTCEYWLLDEQDNIIPPSSTDPTIPYTWLSYDNVRSCGVTDATFIGVMGWLGSARWNNFANGGLTTVNGINYVRSNVRTFNVLENFQAPVFTLGTVRPDLNPLPVRWLSFNGRYFNSGVDLSWSTAAELNNDKFTVERSADGVSFSAIGEVKGRGNSNVNATYAFRDQKPLNGVSYYRIRQTDLDGKESYSDVIKITISNGNAGGFRVFPNPLNGNAQLVLENTAWTNKKVTVTVFNALGAIVRQEQVTFGADSRARLDLSNLQGGSYFIRTQFNNQKEVLPFVIQ